MRRPAAVLIVAFVAVSACGFSTKKHEAELLVHAARQLERARTATGTLAVRLGAPKTADVAALSSNQFGSAQAVPPAPMQLNAHDRIAHVGEPSGIEAVFTGPVVYLKRPAKAAEADSQFGFRAWSRLDFSKLKRKDKNTLGEVNLLNPINPAYLTRMLAGTLSGSVHKLGSGEVGGVAVTHYRMNCDAQKAFSRAPDKERQAVEKAFKSNNLKGPVFNDAEAWIDAHGLPRRFVLRLKQKFTISVARDAGIDVVFPITYTIELANFGAPVTVAAPAPDSVARVGSLNALLQSVRT